jgi:hypothetical protein
MKAEGESFSTRPCLLPLGGVAGSSGSPEQVVYHVEKRVMLAEGRLIVEDATCAHSSVHTLRVHHREFPEIRAEAGSLAEGITHLIAQL